MKTSEEKMLSIFRKNIDLFCQKDSHNWCIVKQSLNQYLSESKEGIITWLKKQDLEIILPFQSFLFWLATINKIPFPDFEEFNSFSNPMLSREIHLPVIMTSGLLTPVFKGGIANKTVEILNYKFEPSGNNKIIISWNDTENDQVPMVGIDLLLDILSFEHFLKSFPDIGFIQQTLQKSIETKNKIIDSKSYATLANLPEIDVKEIELISSRCLNQPTSGLSIAQLLRLRHRAIQDSNLESRLITLWSAIECEYDNNSNEKTLRYTSEEINEIKNSIDKKYRNDVINCISNLKKVTRKENIISNLSKLEVFKNRESIPNLVNEIKRYRNKFAHGTPIEPEEINIVRSHVTLLFNIINEIVLNKLNQVNIA